MAIASKTFLHSTWTAVACAAALLAGAVPALAQEPVQPIAPAKITEPDKVELCKKLWFDPRLSKSGFISCNFCPSLSMRGSDNIKTSIGDRWQQGPINSLTVFNSSLNLAQFWDGRAKDLKEQAGGPIANPGEMGFTHELAVDMLRSMPQCVQEFRAVFGHDRLTIDEVTMAIAAFEETLVTPNARFDQRLKGDTTALKSDELAGHKLFKDSGCVACHNGPNLGGNPFQKMGIAEPFKTTNTAEGRFAVTGKDADRFNFKVPTLRNVELTYPCFHDGSADTLAQAFTVIGRLQSGRTCSDDETGKIVAFLKTLTGDPPQFLLPSSDKTKRPQPFD